MFDLTSVAVLARDDRQRADLHQHIRARPGLLWLGGANALAEARQLLAYRRPHVIVIDPALPDGDGTRLIEEYATDQPSVAFLVVSMATEEASVIRAIEAGARGYLLKHTPVEEIARAVEVVRRGGAPLSPDIASHLLKKIARLPAATRTVPSAATPAATPTATLARSARLTAREITILTRLAQGFNVTETAGDLHISIHTATTHIRNIYGKLQVTNRVQALNQARRRGLIR